MKHFCYMVLFYLVFGITAEAHAGWWYKETPSYLSTQYANEITCRAGAADLSGALSIHCYPEGISAKEQVVIVTDEGRTVVEYFDTVAIADCSQGACVDIQSGDYLGKIDLSRIDPDYRRHFGLDFIKVFSGYYIHMNPDGNITAYRVGTGPLAEDFLIPMIENDEDAFYHDLIPAGSVLHNAPTITAPQGPSMTGGYNDGTYDLWCDPRGDYCHYTADDGSEYKLTRDELLDYIPLAVDTSDCMMEVCYDTDMEVIGLNPDYHLFR